VGNSFGKQSDKPRPLTHWFMMANQLIGSAKSMFIRTIYDWLFGPDNSESTDMETDYQLFHTFLPIFLAAECS